MPAGREAFELPGDIPASQKPRIPDIVDGKPKRMSTKRNRPRPAPRRWNSNRIVSLTAILISVGTFLVFIYQTNLIRQEQYMSVYPYLEFSNYASHSPNYRFLLENTGVGPAMITSTQVLVNGEALAPDIGEYLSGILTPEDSIYFTISNVRKGNLIPEKEQISLVALQPPNVEPDLQRQRRVPHRIRIDLRRAVGPEYARGRTPEDRIATAEHLLHFHSFYLYEHPTEPPRTFLSRPAASYARGG